MQTRLWLAGSATAVIAAAGVFVAGPTLHGQAPGPQAVAPAKPNADSIDADIEQAVREALDKAGLENGQLSVDVRRTIEEATQAAQDAVKNIDVQVMVDDAMQDAMPGLAMLGGRPRIGVTTRDVTADEAKAAGLSGITGAFVSDVPAESAAGKAGLQAHDIIVTVDGETIRSARQLARVVLETPDGRALSIGYVRGTTRGTVSVTPDTSSPRAMTWVTPGGAGPGVRRFERRVPGPGARAERNFDFVMPKSPDGQPFFFRNGPEGGMRVFVGRGRLGVMTQPLTDQLAAYFGVKEGVLVTQVTDESAAAKAGIKAGDVITAIDGAAVEDTGDIIEQLQKVEAGKTVSVAIMRDRKAQTLTVTLPAASNTSGDRVVTRRQRFTA